MWPRGRATRESYTDPTRGIKRRPLANCRRKKSWTNKVFNEAATASGGTNSIQRTGRHSSLPLPSPPSSEPDAPETHKPVFLSLGSVLDLAVVE